MEKSEWKKWKGKRCKSEWHDDCENCAIFPNDVNSGDTVELLFDDGDYSTSRADDYCWGKSNLYDAVILKYRVPTEDELAVRDFISI